MARVTVEDCVTKIPNRFDLVMMAAERAREIAAGTPLTLDRDNDKDPVVALREIADETISLSQLEDRLIRGHQRIVEIEEHEEDVIDLMEGENEWLENFADDVSESMEEAEIGAEADNDMEQEASEAEELSADVLSVASENELIAGGYSEVTEAVTEDDKV